MRIGLVVQRYGLEVAGGAELHARYVAALLARRHDVTVLTTTALDYIRWTPHFPAGEERVEGIRVVRFPVERERDPERYARAQARAFAPGRSAEDEERWLAEQGPWAPGLWAHVREDPARYDALVAFSFRYVTTVETARAAPARTLLVPTAEDDPAVGLAAARELFRGAGAIAYNSPEERAMIEAAAGAAHPAGDVVGIGSRLPSAPDAKRFRDRHGVHGPYAIYLGRIDRNKGCPELFGHWASFLAETALPHELVLVGRAAMEVPDHPRIRPLGFLPDDDRFDALAGADLLLVPSRYESLSMVTLEAMALGVPPLVNGRCAVLRGQVGRANAGLYYDDYEEFFEACRLLLANPRLRELLGANGRRFYREHYSEAVVADKLERLLARLGPAPRG